MCPFSLGCGDLAAIDPRQLVDKTKLKAPAIFLVLRDTTRAHESVRSEARLAYESICRADGECRIGTISIRRADSCHHGRRFGRDSAIYFPGKSLWT